MKAELPLSVSVWGVTGGTVAFVSGIYQRLFTALPSDIIGEYVVAS